MGPIFGWVAKSGNAGMPATPKIVHLNYRAQPTPATPDPFFPKFR